MFRLTHTCVVLLLLSACATDSPPPVDVAGTCAPAYSGEVCSFAQTIGDSVTEVGAVVSLAAIEGAPAEHAMAWPPAMEASVSMPVSAQAASGLTEATMYWEPTGHPPGPFLTPHFDFHFNLVPSAVRMAIDCTDRTKPATLPAGYGMEDLALPPELVALTGVDTLFGTCVPQMGMHALPLGELSATEPFRGSMVVGYYGGKPAFIEPMISKAMLMEKQSFDLMIPEIPGVDGPYPRTFRATWDDAKQRYRFAFSGFTAGT